MICKSASMDNVYAQITDYKPDVLLIDPFMEDGLCIKSLKQIQQMLPSLTVIVLAAVVDASSKLELSKIGIKFILEKKVSSDQLVDTLRLVEAIKRGGNGHQILEAGG